VVEPEMVQLPARRKEKKEEEKKKKEAGNPQFFSFFFLLFLSFLLTTLLPILFPHPTPGSMIADFFLIWLASTKKGWPKQMLSSTA